MIKSPGASSSSFLSAILVSGLTGIHKEIVGAERWAHSVAVVEVRIVATYEFSEAELQALRELLDHAFEGGFTDDDWDHTVGGLHVLAVENGIVSHAAVVERLLLAAHRPLRTGYVEGVATALEHRGRGHSSTVMREIGKLIRESYELGGSPRASRISIPGSVGRCGGARPTRVRREGPSGRPMKTAPSWCYARRPRSNSKRRFP